MALSAGSVYALLGGKFERAAFDQYGAAMYRARDETTAAERRMTASHDRIAQSSSRMGQAATTAAAGGVAALAFGMYKTVKAASDFDAAMRNVNSIAGLNDKQFKALSKSVIALAGPTAQAPKTLAEGMYQLVSSGFKAHDALTILKSSAKAATAGLTDTSTATEAVAAVLNAYQLKAKDAGTVSDQLFQTVNRGVITFETLAHNIGNVLPFAASLGVGLDQVGASVSTLTKEGLSGELAITNLKNVMSAFLKPSKGLAAAIKETGFQSGESLVKAKGFQGALEAVAGTTDGTKKAMAGLFPNIRALTAALDLTGSSTRTANADVKAFGDTAGATQKVFNEQSKSLAFQMRDLGASISAVAIIVGSSLIPPLAKAASGIARFLTQMEAGKGAGGRFADEVKTDFESIERAIGPTIEAIGRAFSSIGKSLSDGSSAFKELGQQIGAVLAFIGKGAADELSHAAGAVAGGVKVIVGAIRLLEAVLHGDIGGAFRALGSIANGTLHAVAQGFMAFASPIRTLAGALGHALESPFRSAASTILGLFSTILSAGASVVKTMSGIPIIGGAFKGLANGIQDAADSINQLRDRINGVKPPPNLKVQIQDAEALAALRRLEGTKIGNKVVRVLANKTDADSKIKALIALGIPPKTARVLANVGNALSGIQSVKGAISTLQGKTVYIDTVNRVHAGATTSPGRNFGPQPGKAPHLAQGRAAGTGQVALVGEGAAPEWVVNPGAGTAQFVTGPTMMNLAPADYVIPTESKYRGRALGLLADVAASLGAAFAGGKKGHHRYVPTPKEYLRLAPDQFDAREQRAQSRYDKLRQNKKTKRVDLAFAKEGRDEARATARKARRFAAHIAALEQDAEIAGIDMGTADSENDQNGYNKAKNRRRGRLDKAYQALLYEHARAKPGSQWERDIRQALAQIRGDIHDTATATAQAPGEFTKKEQTRLDQINADIALASLTEDTADDIKAATSLVNFLNPILASAQAHPGARGGITAVADLAGQVKSARDNLASLTDPGSVAAAAGGSAGPTPDQQALLDQANLRATNAEAAIASQAAVIRAFGSPGDIGIGTGQGTAAQIVFQSYVPPSPQEALRLANYVVGGIDYQGASSSPRDTLGV